MDNERFEVQKGDVSPCASTISKSLPTELRRSYSTTRTSITRKLEDALMSAHLQREPEIERRFTTITSVNGVEDTSILSRPPTHPALPHPG